ncbi:MSMEG_4193 family putative phosphomutase [Raineyella fluvialis]|uniref:MSMEG_4193 family putative phosphomutase n=1 Tax=Raineyella fluvialis TaxID=2662261 RepID=A0A5Q2FD59_9ACTN|nr:MSMEG_4193 family putative phosphomutase [Raineyella fluvialis]QGF24882.1 MSMEG_4193 family putative phosphomutase [Raineyella fluvialis]
MTILLLVRHGRTTANASGILAGRTPGIRLDATGWEQARAAGQRLSGLTLAAAVSSPMERCLETARALHEVLGEGRPELVVDDALSEVDYGEWSGRALEELAKEELWRTVQAHPSAARFPGGESMVAMAQRAVSAVRARQDTLADEAGAEAVWLAVSHGDIIKAVLADALGLHLDHFQRLVVHPASISVVRYTTARPYVLALNSTAGIVRDLLPEDTGRSLDAVVGGGAGSAT